MSKATITRSTTIGELFDTAREFNAAVLRIVLTDARTNKPTYAVIVVRGEEVEEVVAAVEAIENSWDSGENVEAQGLTS